MTMAVYGLILGLTIGILIGIGLMRWLTAPDHHPDSMPSLEFWLRREAYKGDTRFS